MKQEQTGQIMSDRERNRLAMPLIAEFVDALRAELDEAAPGRAEHPQATGKGSAMELAAWGFVAAILAGMAWAIWVALGGGE